MKGTPAAPGRCAGCGHEGTVFPTYRPRGGEPPPAECEVVPPCSACRIRGANFHGAVARERGEPLFEVRP